MGVAPLVLLILAASRGLLALGAPARWELFESRSQHFSVRYPSSWNRLQDRDVPPDPDVLEIINFPNAERVEGVIIKKSGAKIDVLAAPRDVHSIGDWIRKYGLGDALVGDHDILVASPAPDGCLKLRRLVSRSELGPGTYSTGTDYFCSTARGLYRVSLTNWEVDPHQGHLQDIALKIALSLRSR